MGFILSPYFHPTLLYTCTSQDTSEENAPISFSVEETSPSFTIEATRKRVNNENIKFYEITYCCIHSGKSFKAREGNLHVVMCNSV